MVHLELTQASAEVLRNTLDWYLSELRVEIANTDSKAFRDELKEQKMVLIEIVDELDQQLPESADTAAPGTGAHLPHTAH